MTDPDYWRRYNIINRDRIRARKAARRAADPAVRAAETERSARWRAANRDRKNENNRRYRKANKQKVSDYAKRYVQDNPAVAAAHNALHNATRDGRFHRQEVCSECGSGRFVVAHHDDYSRPLDVRWLCRICHNHHHENERRELAS